MTFVQSGMPPRLPAHDQCMPLCVDEIIQKSKVKIYEEGLEASAATGMIMKNTAVLNPEQPKEFRADHAFSFYITQGTETQELLFWGQIVR